MFKYLFILLLVTVTRAAPISVVSYNVTNESYDFMFSRSANIYEYDPVQPIDSFMVDFTTFRIVSGTANVHVPEGYVARTTKQGDLLELIPCTFTGSRIHFDYPINGPFYAQLTVYDHGVRAIGMWNVGVNITPLPAAVWGGLFVLVGLISKSFLSA